MRSASRSVLLAFLSLALGLAARSQSTPSRSAVAATQQSTHAQSRYAKDRFPKRASMYYSAAWGIESLVVRSTESGELVRFSYRVIDADKAKALSDKKSEPSLMDFRAGVKLVIPSLEKVGQLRQSGTPQSGKEYWMAFSNPHRDVKRGDRVDIIIGSFRAEGLIVE